MIKIKLFISSTFIFLLSTIGTSSIANSIPNQVANLQPSITRIIYDEKKIVTDRRIVVTLSGKDLHLIDKVKVMLKGVSAGTAVLEKYTTKNNSERRVVIDFRFNRKAGTIKLLAESNRKVLISTHKIQIRNN